MKKLSLQIVFIFSLYLTSTAQEWEWQNPFPVGNSHNDIAWIDDQTFYISGGKGQFIKTSDFGQSWEVANVPADVSGNIDFVSATKGWMSTSNGEIWLTEDAGDTWVQQYADMRTPTLMDMSFFNETGYSSGDLGFADNVILKTTDGGANWEAATLPFREGASFYGMFFTKAINEDTVYAASWDNTFFKSYDQGVTWDTVHLPDSPAGYYEGGYFVNDSTGFIVGPNGYIVKTTDYGDNWEVVFGSAEFTDEPTYYLSEVYFLDNQKGWASSFGCLYSTTDGGTTWSSSCEDTYGTVRKSFIQFNEQGRGIALANTEIYITENGTDFTTVLPVDPINDLYSITEVEGHLYIAAEGGKIFHSSDQGQNWLIMETPATATLEGVQFADSNNAWAVGRDSTVLKTTDAGLNWEAFDLDYNTDFNDLYVWSASSSIVVGDEGGIFITTDGGTTWVKGDIESESNINAVYFVDANTGYVVGRSGLLAKTTDGGANWTIQDPGVLSHINDIFFLDGNKGYAVGQSGKILVTENAGTTWAEQVSGESGTLNAVYFIDQDHGYVAGNGKILFTEDGGQNWVVQDTPSDNALRDVYFNEDGNGWAVGRNGNILFNGEIIEPLGIEKSISKILNVYPNPASSKATFTLENKYNGVSKLAIYDISGSLVFNSELTFQSGVAKWNVESSILTGIYSFKLILPEQQHNGRLIIQH